MDSLFQLGQASRAEFLHLLMQKTGCTYICLWSYRHPPNCLVYWDGCYNEQINQPRAFPLFLAYQQQVFPLENDLFVPGFAFRYNSPYIEFGELELLNRVSNQTQRQFYQEAGIKKAVFMGCKSGEIELGLSNEVQLNLEMEMRSFFHEDFSRLSPGNQLPQPQQTDPNRPSSSSSSLRSFSTGSPDSSMIFTIPTAVASQPRVPAAAATATADQTASGSVLQTQAVSSSITDPHQQAMQSALSQIRSNIQLPTIESENAAMTRAILAILTSPSSSSSSTMSHHQTQNLHPNATAFRRYANSIPPPALAAVRGDLRGQSMLKRAILFYKRFNQTRREQLLRSRPTSNQLHHMISERKRREKLNDSFHALRSLLPSGTKKDKASVLASAKDYLNSLRAQIVELNRRNQLLEGQLLPSKEGSDQGNGVMSTERYSVGITPVSESTSEQRIIDLRMSLRGGRSVVDVLIELLEFLKLDRNVSLMSIESTTHEAESDADSVLHINTRLRIEGNGWDESAFLEAVRRLIADLAQ